MYETSFYVSPEDISKKYVPLGIHYFKINGREFNEINGFRNIVEYCIKPEYRMDVRTFMIERLFCEMKKDNYERYIKNEY